MYEGEGKKRRQIWESGLSYSDDKAQIEYEMSRNIHV